MTIQVSRHPRHERGFGLVELLVTLLVMGLVLAGVFGVFFRSQNQTTRVSKVADQRQNARTAVQLIEREIRMAGSGWGRLTVEASDGDTLSLGALMPGPGPLTGSDSLRLIGAWQASTALSSPMATTTSTTTVTSASGFATNDLFLITNGSAAHLFRVTGITGNTLNHATSSPWNALGGHNAWPGGGYASGAQVYKTTLSTYRFDTVNFRKPALVRHEFGQSPQIIAYNVAGFRVWYLMQDGTWTRNPGTDVSSVDKVVPVVLTQVTDSNLPTVVDSVWAAVRPRTF